MIETPLEVMFSTLEFTSLFLLALSLFRLPIRYNWLKIIIVSFVLSLIYHYQSSIDALAPFVFITQIFLFVILLWLLFDLSLVFAILVGVIGYIMFVIVQVLLVQGIIFLDITTADSIQSSVYQMAAVQFVESCLIFAIVWWMQTRKLGFMFIMNRTSLKKNINVLNIYLASVIVAAVLNLELLLISMQARTLIITFISTVILLGIGMFLTYKKNKQELRNKYERSGKQLHNERH